MPSEEWAFEKFGSSSTARRAQEQRQKEVRIQRKKEVRRKAPRIEPVLPTLQIGARVEKERQTQMFEATGAGKLPPLSILDDPANHVSGYSAEALEAMSRLVELKLRDFGVDVEVGGDGTTEAEGAGEAIDTAGLDALAAIAERRWLTRSSSRIRSRYPRHTPRCPRSSKRWLWGSWSRIPTGERPPRRNWLSP